MIKLTELVNSPVMAELQELLMLGPGAEQERDLFNNWFSLQVGCLWVCSFGLGAHTQHTRRQAHRRRRGPLHLWLL